MMIAVGESIGRDPSCVLGFQRFVAREWNE